MNSLFYFLVQNGTPQSLILTYGYIYDPHRFLAVFAVDGQVAKATVPVVFFRSNRSNIIIIRYVFLARLPVCHEILTLPHKQLQE